MVFWRRKKNDVRKEQDELDQELFHSDSEPALEPVEESDGEIPEDLLEEIEESGKEILEELKEVPMPEQVRLEKARSLEEERTHDEEQESGGWLSRLSRRLGKSSSKIGTGITSIFTHRKLDEETLEELEELLITADLGPKTAKKLVADFSKNRFGKEISDEEVREELAKGMEAMLTPVAKQLDIVKPEGGPFVVLVCGVNGVGKTTTVGKLAHLLKNEGSSVMLGAGDTFRAAAVEQLQEWGKRTHCTVIAKDTGADAAALAFEAYEKAKVEAVDVLMIDTAGRLHNKSDLMDELKKIVRVLKKQNEDLPHATLLVLDATTGQNAHSQVETFRDMVDVTGLIVTKLDGSAKGGVLVSLADTFGLPVHAIGIGESADDMQPFKPHEYARSLMGLPEE